jgi:hypothetical protein
MVIIGALGNNVAAQVTAGGNSCTSDGDNSIQSAAEVQSSASIPDLNRKTLNFAIQHLGQQVGDGKCTSLVAAALQSAGASLARGFVFGRQLDPNEQWLPGDIIEFTDCLFVERNGAQWHVGTPYHASIICAINAKHITLLQQNSNHDPRTQKQTLDFDTLARGSYKVYRPIPNGQSNAYSAQSTANNPVGNLAEILQQPIVPGPMAEERQQILTMIRDLQTKRVNTYLYRKRFQDIEMRIAASYSNSLIPIAGDLADEIVNLRRELNTSDHP